MKLDNEIVTIELAPHEQISNELDLLELINQTQNRFIGEPIHSIQDMKYKISTYLNENFESFTRGEYSLEPKIVINETGAINITKLVIKRNY